MQNAMDFVQVVNRTTEPLDAKFDGIPIVLVPGYKQEGNTIVPAGENGTPAYTTLPRAAAERAKWQNPQMGTADPESPSDMDFKVGVAEWGDEIDYLPPTDAVELIDRDLLEDEARTAVPVQTRAGRRLNKKGRRSRFVDTKLKNTVMGAKTDYND